MGDSLPFTFGLCAAYLLVVFAGVFACTYLFHLYRVVGPGEGAEAESDDPEALPRNAWAMNFEFTPEDLGGFSYWRLAVASVLGLFLELLLIRWVSSEIRVFACFKNFVLIACFLGFGLGCYCCRRRMSLLPLLVPLLTLALVVELPWPSLRRAYPFALLSRAMDGFVASRAQRDQVFGVVMPKPTSPLTVMNLQILHGAAHLAVPIIPH